MNKETYFFSRLSAENVGELNTLHTAVYGKTVSFDLFPNKYDTRCTGAEYIGFIAHDKQALPIAFYGVIPCFMLINGEKVLAAQSADTMTHPNHRNKGLFVQLAQLTYELCRIKTIRFLFGFPNQNSLPGFINKLGWQMTETMDRFVIPVKTIPLERIAGKSAFFKRLYNAHKQKVLKKYLSYQKGIPGSVLADGFGGVLRDDNYLQYKSYSNTITLKIDATTIWLKANKGLMIGDISVVGEDTFDHVMYKLVNITRKLGMDQIHFHISPGTRLHALFALRYDSATSFPAIFKDLDSGIAFDKIKFTFADIDIF